jgi:hypothetical protein
VTADVFAQHYELHYQNKKVHLEGCETTLAVQFVCIAFHPTCYGGRARLTPIMRNKWMALVIGFIARCLRSRWSMFEAEAKRIIL